jgi:colanic acid/amylovoran biosynthesis glycosyltransferase
MGILPRRGVKLVVHFHGYDAHNQDEIRSYRERYAAMFDYASAVIAVSSKMGSALLQLGLPEGKLFYNPCGIDVSMFAGANPSAAPPQFLSVGRFVDKKAPHLTLLAFREALQRAPEAALTMAGNGPLLEACRQMARGLEIASSVAFPGVLPSSRIAEMMRAARGFVQHSVTTTYGDSEGTPVAVLEAGASGLPVVSTYHAGIGEAVIHERTGLLVEEGDIRGMGAHMARLALDASYAGQLGAQARRHIADNYDIEKTVERLNRILAWSAGQVRERPESWPEWRSPAVSSMQL